jgi:hypothetical protein
MNDLTPRKSRSSVRNVHGVLRDEISYSDINRSFTLQTRLPPGNVVAEGKVLVISNSLERAEDERVQLLVLLDLMECSSNRP